MEKKTYTHLIDLKTVKDYEEKGGHRDKIQALIRYAALQLVWDEMMRFHGLELFGEG